MPITLTYDIASVQGSNHHNYIRSMFERFGWRQIGGSTLMYSVQIGKEHQEDWMNEVVPALMFFRSYILKNKLNLKKFTLNANSFTMLDVTGATKLGRKPLRGDRLKLKKPVNTQSGVEQLRNFVDGCVENVSR